MVQSLFVYVFAIEIEMFLIINNPSTILGPREIAQEKLRLEATESIMVNHLWVPWLKLRDTRLNCN